MRKRLSGKAMYFLGIDIGGTKITTCIGDDKGNILCRKTLSTQPFQGAKKGVPAIISQLESLMQESSLSLKEITALGICAPGPLCVKSGKLLSPPNLPGWENTPLVESFEKVFKMPIFFNNDANGAVLAEWEFGKEKKTANLLYLTMSTGIGGGVIIDNELLQGVTDTAGEVGHFVLDPKGPDCFCGQKGCFEAFCGGASIAKRLQREIREKKISTEILKEVKGDIEKIDLISLQKGVQKKDPYALSIWDELIERLAQALGILLQTLNPEAIILGTLATSAKNLLLDPLRKKLPSYAWKEPLEACKIEASHLGDNRSELSAIALALYNIEKKERKT